MVPVRDGFVGFSKRLEQLLVIPGKIGTIDLPVIPNNKDPPIRSEQPPELPARRPVLEPVKSLGNRDSLERRIRQTGLLRGGGNRMKPRKVPQILLRRPPHRLIRFNRRDLKSGFQKQPGKNPGSRTNIRHRGAIFQAAGIAHQVNHARRIARPIPPVILRAI